MNSLLLLQPARPPVADTQPGVTVVITTFNHARFLGEAIESVLRQTCPPDLIIVVDDGSSDRPDAVVSCYPEVLFIRQQNQGLSAARNTGLTAAQGKFIVFLDADDLLLPRAIELGLQAHRRSPGAAFVYGGHRRTDADCVPIGGDYNQAVGSAPFSDLLHRNLVAMHGAVLFDRRILLEAGGYDPALRSCEDYDVFLRLARTHPVASYPEVVALYRIHGDNMSGDHKLMLHGALQVLDRHARGLDKTEMAAARDGRRFMTGYYAGTAISQARVNWRRHPLACVPLLAFAVGHSPGVVARHAASILRRRIGRVVSMAWRAFPRRPGAIALGSWRSGDFGRAEPASQDFGWERGQPIDRYYVDAFLRRRRLDIAGRVLEVGEDFYCHRYGGSRVLRQDILDIDASNPSATIVGDIADPALLPADAFDCMVLTQVLHLVFDLQAAVRNIFGALKPGGVALVTVPGISQIDRSPWGDNWCWSLTAVSAERLFGDVFGAENVSVEAHGNFLAATSFLAGLAQSEIDVRKLDAVDPAYPVVITIRAQKHG